MDVSNKTLAVLLIAAIVVSLGGTLLSSGGQKTGYATTGTINYSVDDNFAVDFTTTNIDFGTGSVDIGNGPCVLESSTAPNGGCVGFETSPGTLTFDNIGNTACSVTLDGDETETVFIGSASDAEFIVSGCTTITSGFETYTSIDSIESGATTVCNNMATDDSGVLGLRLTIAEADATSGTSGTLTLTIGATDAV